MTAKIIQLTFPFVRTRPSQPKRGVQYNSDLNDSPTSKRRMLEEADMAEIIQYMIQAHLQRMYDKARAREAKLSGREDEGNGKAN